MNRSYRGSRLIVFGLVLGSLILLTLDLRSDSSFDGVRRLVASVVSPVQGAVRGAAQPISDFLERAGTMWSSASRISELEAENERLRIELSQSKDSAGRSKQFEALMDTAGLAGYKVVAARVIATESVSGLVHAISIDVGTGDGVRDDMTVMTGDGLVGRVTRATRHSSTVLLLTDPTFRVGVRLIGTDILGIASGRGGATLDLQLLDPQATLREGDVVLARGSYAGRPFVPGLPVGKVVSVADSPGALTKTARLRPLVSTGRLDIVGVVVAAPARDPRDALVPTAPTPTPIPTVTIYSTEPQPSTSPTQPTPTPTPSVTPSR